ncbi:hypothetical protein [Flavobacterium sp.]|jgi:hypothetical protein|uniref:hypothetical protein n=1 Tax=Flavobacterium sp. TaxID=239 RepID=UPI0037BFADFE
MNTKNIDTLNIFLILISLVLAYFLPFELFLFSYAVLGPLHYATEISWLDKKNYFVHTKKWVIIFLLFCIIISIPSLLRLPFINQINNLPFFKNIGVSISKYKTNIILITFLLSIGLIYIQKVKTIIFYLLFCIAISYVILSKFSFSVILVGVFLPTIIHVYLFTLLFMVYGTMGSKSKTGSIAIILMILCPFIIANLNISLESYLFSKTIHRYYIASGMDNLNRSIALFFDSVNSNQFQLISKIGVKIQIFIAFCYTYHYLNWFSKTSIIGWNRNISKTRISIILIIWLTSILLYWYNYKVGLSALFFLSMLHVFLEFPLNITTIKAIVKRMLFIPKVKEINIKK